MADRAQIQIKHKTREHLFERKNSSTDSYDDVIQRLLGSQDVLSGPVDGKCPVCGEELTAYHNIKNGSWAWEPIGNFGLDNEERGMICASWNARRLYIYFHSEEIVDAQSE